jgi:hypothetical protein
LLETHWGEQRRLVGVSGLWRRLAAAFKSANRGFRRFGDIAACRPFAVGRQGGAIMRAARTRKSKLRSSSKHEPTRRTRVGHYERGRIEEIVASAGRAHQLVHDTWGCAADISPLMLSAILREVLIAIGAVKGAANNLAETFLDRSVVQP